MKSLWQQFATRYKDETQIAYYDILNEPKTSGSNWPTYAQTLVTAIRAIDTNHLLDIQMDVDSPVAFTVTDSQNNVMYDSHFYDPYFHTTLFSRNGWQGQYQTTSSNPWPVKPWDLTWGTATGSLLPSSPTGTFGWTQYETTLFTPPSAEHIFAQPVFVAPSGGTMYFDDFQLVEVAPDNTEQLLETVELENTDTGYPADAPYKVYLAQLTRISGSGNATAQTAAGNIHRGLASISFPASSKFTADRLAFPVRQGYSYKIRGWLKGASVTGSGGFGVRWGDWPYGTFEPLIKTTLQTHLLADPGDYIYTYYISRNIPVNAGEWGLSPYSFAEKSGYYVSAGGLDYVRDVVDLFQQNNINSAYWAYSRFNNYYIYQNCPPFTTSCQWPAPENANQPLVDLFTEILAGSPPSTATNTPLPSTPTATSIPPTATNTPLPPTPTSTPAGTLTTIFSDDFETDINWITSGDVIWFNGTPKLGAYSVQLKKVGIIEKTISTSGYDYISVSFYLGANSLDNSSEYVQALWYDGSSWNLLKQISNGDPEENNQLNYFEYQLPTSASNNPNLALQFKVVGSGTADYGYTDNVLVTGYSSGPTPIPTATTVLPTATSTSVPPTPTNTTVPPTPTNTAIPPTPTNTPISSSQRVFLDDFEAAFSGWSPSGTINWYTGVPKNGTYGIQLASSGAWMQKTISTAGYQNIIVRVYMGAESFEASEAFKLFWWNGSSWVSLKAITDGAPEEDGQLHFLEFTLPSTADNKSTFKLAFQLQSSDATDYGYLDDVEVWGTP